MHIFSFVLLLALALPSQEQAFTEAELLEKVNRFQLFNNCAGMDSEVFVVATENGKGVKLTKAQVQTTIESRLRSARLYSDKEKQFLETTVQLRSSAYSVVVSYKKFLYDSVSDFGFFATTRYGPDPRAV